MVRTVDLCRAAQSSREQVKEGKIEMAVRTVKSKEQPSKDHAKQRVTRGLKALVRDVQAAILQEHVQPMRKPVIIVMLHRR